ncbi:MAG: hypothetical protein JOZ16_04535 [Methylobacteriaceae bacterium]|nr:hypothetical protein [Methylobacteriaceae bacterium]
MRTLIDRLPRHGNLAMSRRLSRKADAARDHGRFAVAAALYAEALRFTPDRVRVIVQCAHMHKESGDYSGAERYYLAALQRAPNDADLALQLGHFNKLIGRVHEAQRFYGRALELQPGWPEALKELSSLRDRGDANDDAVEGDVPLPELLPIDVAAAARPGEHVQLFRLGARRVSGLWGRRVLRGVEAIRGYCVSAAPLVEVQLLLDGQLLRSVHLQPSSPPSGQAPSKFVFNIWHDFATAPRGRRPLELRYREHGGRIARALTEMVWIGEPLTEAECPSSDAVVDPGRGEVEASINARASMIRRADRSVVGGPMDSILVQRFDQLGDLVISVPALRRLRALFPQARIVGLLSAANAELAATLRLFDEILTIRLPEDPALARRTMSASEQRALQGTLARFRFDLAIDLIDTADSRALLRLSGARFLYGFNERETPWLDAGLETRSHDPANELENTPLSGKLVALIERLGAMTSNPLQVVARTDLERSLLQRFGIAAGERYIVLHAGSRLGFNRWHGYGALAAWLLRETSHTIVILSESEEDIDVPAEILGVDRLKYAVGRLPFDAFDALLSFCDAFVGNDSGPKQVATLRGARVVSVHMPRLNWNEWGQEGDGLIVSRRIPCAGCALTRFEDCGQNFACMRFITPAEVGGAVLRLLCESSAG